LTIITIDYQVTFPDNSPNPVLSGNFPMIIQYQVTFPDNSPNAVLSGNFPMIIQISGIFSLITVNTPYYQGIFLDFSIKTAK